MRENNNTEILKRLWVRLGTELRLTEYEANEILSRTENSSGIFKKVLREGRHEVCGNSYVPFSSVELYNKAYGTSYTENDIDLELGGVSKPIGIVSEYCSNCETEIELIWDVKKRGYKAYCPVCGSRLMLCDACEHPDGEFCDTCDYDILTDTCKHNK